MTFVLLLTLVVPTTRVEALTPPRPCPMLETNLRFGTQSNPTLRYDVIVLQDLLRAQGLLNSPSTGYFGSLTLAAVKRFQAANGVPATGFVGVLTRAQFNAVSCGRGGSVSITDVSGPTTLLANQAGTWSVVANAKTASNLSYSVSWGDEYQGYVYTPTATAATANVTQASTFTHTYTKAGTYTATFNVQDLQNNSSARKSITVVVMDPSQPKITVTAPNGNERWYSMTNKTISWTASNLPAGKVDIYLTLQTSGFDCGLAYPCAMNAVMPMPILLDKNIPGPEYHWIVATDMYDKKLSRGQYKVRICPAGSSEWAYGESCDESDTAFTIIDPEFENNLVPVINRFTGPTTLRVGETGTWTVSAYDPEGTTLEYTARWDKGPTTGSEGAMFPYNTSSGVFTTAFSTAGTYQLRFRVQDTAGKHTENSISVQVQN